MTVRVYIDQLKTLKNLKTETIHVSYQYLPNHRIEFTFDIKFYGDDIVYQSHAVIDISESNNPESNRSFIFRPSQSIKTPADANSLGFIKFRFNISEQQQPPQLKTPRSSPTTIQSTRQRSHDRSSSRQPSPKSSPTARRPTRSNGSPTTTGRRRSHGSPSSSSSDLLFLGLLLVGVTVAGLGIGMSSV